LRRGDEEGTQQILADGMYETVRLKKEDAQA
jgi:hypothetical protein